MKLSSSFLCLVTLVFVSKADDFSLTEKQIEEINNLVYETTLLVAAGISYTIDSTLLPVSEDDVQFRFFNNETADVNGTEVYLANATIVTNLTDFDTSLDTVFITHGWNNNCTESPMITYIKSAIFALGNFNIFTVCWDDYSGSLYTTAYAAVPQVGQYLGEFIGNISDIYDYDLTHFTLIGHSLGAHISGYAGKQLKGTLPHIVGLDPAGPLYTKLFSTLRLASTDAEYVEAIHTDGSLLGVNYAVGDVDYWPNGGLIQPGCGVDIETTCSHGRSYYYYAESLNNNQFVSTECSLYATFLLQTCSHNVHSLMGGLTYNTSISGNFYLKTNSASPYALGYIGL